MTAPLIRELERVAAPRPPHHKPRDERMPNAPRFCPAVSYTNRCGGPQLNPFGQPITAHEETDVHAAAIPLAADPCAGGRERQPPGNRRTHPQKPERPHSTESTPTYVSVKFSTVRLPQSGLTVNADRVRSSTGLNKFHAEVNNPVYLGELWATCPRITGKTSSPKVSIRRQTPEEQDGGRHFRLPNCPVDRAASLFPVPVTGMRAEHHAVRRARAPFHPPPRLIGHRIGTVARGVYESGTFQPHAEIGADSRGLGW